MLFRAQWFRSRCMRPRRRICGRQMFTADSNVSGIQYTKTHNYVFTTRPGMMYILYNLAFKHIIIIIHVLLKLYLHATLLHCSNQDTNI